MRGKKVFNLLGRVANHDSDVSNPASREGTQLHLKHRMACVYRQKAFGKLFGGGSQTTPIACVQDNRFHSEVMTDRHRVIPFGISTSVASVAGGAIGCMKMSRRCLGNKRKLRRNQEKSTVENRKQMHAGFEREIP